MKNNYPKVTDDRIIIVFIAQTELGLTGLDKTGRMYKWNPNVNDWNLVK